MFYLKLFKTLNDYNNNKDNLLLPNISVVTNTNEVFREKYELPYLTITALEDDLTVSFSTNSCQYSLNGIDWNDLQADEQTPSINSGEKIYFKAEGLTPNRRNGIGTFTVSKKFNLSGNVMSMIFGDNAQGKTDLTGYDWGFSNLFRYCTGLVSVSKNFLPVTTLAEGCYNEMFKDCTSLVQAPELPATTLAQGCYANMFDGCTSLLQAPELPATTLVEGCYGGMFNGCTSLNYIKMLAKDIGANMCLYEWVFNISETGTFVKSVDNTLIETGVNGIPTGWIIETV